MAGNETYIDAVLLAIETDKVALGVVNVIDGVDFEQDTPRKANEYPTIMVGEGPIERVVLIPDFK